MARITFFLPNMQGGGAERVALTLMRDFVARGHEINLVLMQAVGELMPLLPSAVRVADLKVDRIRQAIVPFARHLKEARPDAVQVSMWPLTAAAVLARRWARTPTRLVLSDHINLSRQYGSLDPVRYRLMRKSISLLYPLADARVIVSEGAADDLARLSGLARSSITVIPNPIEPLGPVCASDRTAAERHWPRGGQRILTVGSLKRQKDQQRLITAFADLVASREAVLMILGEGELRGELKAHACALGVANRVAMPGFFVDPAPFYATADLFVLSSDHEGFGNVLVEALQAGLRIVSTNCPDGPAEILASGKFGRLVPVADAAALTIAMGESLDEPANRNRQRARAAAYLPHFAADRYLTLLLENVCRTDTTTT